MVVELQQRQSFRCPGCGRTYEIRPAATGSAPGAQGQAQQTKRMTANQESLIEDYCTESQLMFPQGFASFTVDQASNWIEANIPPEYIAWRRRKLYGTGSREGP